MKKLLQILLINYVLLTSIFAQSPNGMSYQAVIRDSDGNIVRDSQIGMRISIVQNHPDGYAVYIEERITTTNLNGLVSIEIGSSSEGSTVSSELLNSAETVKVAEVGKDFSSINWGDGPYFIKVETDITGGTSYTIIGTSQLLSVPYAKYADKAANVKFADGVNNNDAVYTDGNVGIGTSSPISPLHLVTNAVPALTISSLTKNNPNRPGIQFSNNTSHFISGDGLSNELFGFYSIWSSNREYDAKLRVYGRAIKSWGKYIELTHDGTNGSIKTDVGDINMFPAGEVIINGNLNVTGKILTGMLGQGYSAVFPEVIDNTATIEIQGVSLIDNVTIVSSIGSETDRVSVNQGVDSNGDPIYREDAGYTMEFPLMFETSTNADVQTLKTWFDQASPSSRMVTILIDDLAGNETGRWNLYDYEPDGYSDGSDGRTKFTLVYDGVPDNKNSCEYQNDFGSEHSFNSETDFLIEIQGVSTGTNFTPAVEINTEDRTITLSIDYNEGYKIYDWVKETISGSGSGKSMSIIQTSDGTPSTETSRYNYFNCIPIKYEHFYGFGLNIKLKARLVIAYGTRAEG